MSWKEANAMELRKQFVRDYKLEVRSVKDLCALYGISRQTGYKWIERYEQEGLADPMQGQWSQERSHARHTMANRTPAGIEQALMEMRQSHPGWGARKLLARHGAVYIGPALGSKWAANRFKGPYLRNTLWELGYSVDTIETAVDWPQVKPLMLAMEQAARDAFAPLGTPVHAFTHLSHLYPQGSSIYSQYVWPTAAGGFEPNFARWQALKKAVAAQIAAHGGTVSHQHGVGRDHAAHLAREKGQLGMATLAGLCRQFDPHGIMNPGKLLQDGGPWRD